MKEKMFKFIKIKTPHLMHIENIELKDYDDEYGAIGEHYVVRCFLKVKEEMAVKKTCLVNAVVFNNWARKEESIMWI